MDTAEVKTRSLLALVGGVVAVVIGALMVRSQLGELDPSTAVYAFGWFLAGIGGMAVQASFVGLLVAVKPSAAVPDTGLTRPQPRGTAGQPRQPAQG